MVRVERFELSIPWALDFLTTLCRHSRTLCVVVWTMSLPYLLDLGRWYIVSTHLGFIHLARRCLRESFAELATIHIRSFLS